MSTFLGGLAGGLLDALEDLAISFENEGTFQRFLARFGWNASIDAAALRSIRTALADIINLFSTLEALYDQLQGDSGDEFTLAQQLINGLISLISALRALTSQPAGVLPFPLNQAEFWNQVPLELVDTLLIDDLEFQNPLLLGILLALGLAEIEPVTPMGTGRIPYLRHILHWDRLGRIVTDPEGLLREIYSWDNSAIPFNHERFLHAVQQLFYGVRLPVRYEPLNAALAALYYAPTNPALPNVHQLAIPIVTSAAADRSNYVELGLLIFPIPAQGQLDSSPVGFALTPQVTGTASGAVSNDNASFTLALSGGFQTSAAFAVEIRPHAVNLHIAGGQPSINAALSTSGYPETPWLLIGSRDSHRIEVAGVLTGVHVRGQLSDLEVIIEAGVIGQGTDGSGGAALVVDFSEGDGLLQKLLGGNPQRLDISFKLRWSNKTGFGISGQAKFEANIPVHQSIANVLVVDSIYVALRAGGAANSAALQAALVGGLNIGPVAATVDRVGVVATLKSLTQTDPPGNLGTLDLQFAFKPPNGLGLLIDAGAVVGGGYVFFDADKGEYAGVLELKLEAVQVKIIGLLDTKLPDGTPGFSFLLIVSVEFTPIQLGFGFSLNGVGGLAGINRTMLLDVLRAGLRNRTLNSILFPQDPVRHAAQLISDLRSVFPPVEGRYLFGPMLEIAWGGFILVAKLGVVLELPAPVRLAILGQITAAMPTQDEALIIIHMDVLGAIDFEQKKLSIDATLYDSRIEIYALLGDMALRLTWGDNPNFALSLGGFFPGFQPPPGFPALRRLMLSVSDGAIVQLSESIYLAFTSNSVQFGANLELKVDHDGVSIHGYLGYDAFFIFSPFSFIAHMQGDVELKTGGTSLMSIRLDATLTGPTPWHVQGSASIDMLFFSISVHVDEKFGDDQEVTLPQIKVLPQLLDALKNPQNWYGSLPGGAETAVSLAKAEVDDKTILMQPMGLLSVRQTVVPLSVQIAKFNNAAPADADSFDITGVTIGGKGENTADVPDYFASGQFFALSAAGKVSAPSYTRMKAGVKVGSEDLQHGNVSSLELHYETFIVDDLAIPGKKDQPYAMPLATMLAANRIGAAELSLVRRTGNARYVVPGAVSAVSTSDPAYVVASTTDLSVQAGLSTAGGAPYFAATAALAAHLAAHPEDASMLQVLPLHEAVTT